MRSLKENMQNVAYKNLVSDTEIVDEYGNATGSYVPTYSPIQHEPLCVTPAKGMLNHEMFGDLIDYDRIATTSNSDCSINESSILWVDGKSEEEAHNYIVLRKSIWKNSVAYAIREVKVSKDEEDIS